MVNPGNQTSKPVTSHFHVINLIVATVAGIISIVGGVYTLKSNLFSGSSYGSLQGVVRDAKIAKPLVLASVEVAGIDGAVVNTVATDNDGHYLVDPLKAGNYVVKFTAPRHVVQTKTIRIEKDLKSSINVDLVPEAVPAQTIPVEQTVPSQVIGFPQTTTPRTISSGPGVTTTSPDQAMTGTYPPQTYGQVPPVQQGPGFHRRPPRNYYAQPGASSAGASQNNNLTQTGVQLVEAFLTKKPDQSSASGS